MIKIPEISVLLPVYNSARYVRAAIESVLSQTFGDFELLVLNDGSTDHSLQILRELEAKDGRVLVRSTENRGLVPARNELLAMARGQYLAIMDGDDICRPQRLERQLAYLRAHPSCVAVGSRALLIDSSGSPIIESKYELTHEEIDSIHLSGIAESRICHPSAMIRREAIIQSGRYREEFALSEDFDLWLRLAEFGKLANLPEVLIEYRLHRRSASHVHYSRQRDAANKAIIAAWARRRLPGNPRIRELTTKREKAADLHRKWAWWALSAGNLATARKHAIIAFLHNPLSLENLKIIACGFRGY